MNNYILVECITDNYYKLINKLISLNIRIDNINYNKSNVRFIIVYSDYKKLKKYLVTYKFKIIRRYGISHIKDIIKNNIIFILSIILGLIIFLILSNVIVDVKIISSNKDIVKLLSNELDDYNVKRLTFKKDFNELDDIKNKILAENKDKLEWLSIKIDGMNYVINVEERIINKEIIKKDKCNIVANKNGIIKNINNYKGVNVVNINDYVEKGSILITGIIKKDEEVKSYVCASGKVYAEVWYTANIKVPLYYEEVSTTNKVRYNLKVNDYVIFNSRLDKYVSNDKKIFSLFNYNLFLIKEMEVTSVKKKYRKKEVESKIDELVMEKFDVKLKDGESIINKNILKSEINGDVMNAEVFVTVKENIGESVEFKIEEENLEKND